MLIPLSHWAHGRGAAHKLHIAALCGGLSRIPTDSLSLGGWTELGCLCFDKLSIPIVTRVTVLEAVVVDSESVRSGNVLV